MPLTDATELVLIRHAPARSGGRLAGRRDVDCDLPDPERMAGLRAAIGAVDHLVVSPARRCLQTAAAVFPGRAAQADPRLWEQDFGTWEGADPAGLPDLGPLTPAALADHRPPGGESFAELCRRVAPALGALPTGRVAVVAHAGTIRAALAQVLGAPGPALAFEIAPLSLTLLRHSAAGSAILCVNRTQTWG